MVRLHQSSDVLSGTPGPIPKGLISKKFSVAPTLYNVETTSTTGNWKMQGTAQFLRANQIDYALDKPSQQKYLHISTDVL